MKNSNSFQLAARQSLSLSQSNYSATSKHNYRLLQDIGSDKDYNLIINQKTTYLTQDGRQITAEELAQLSGKSKRQQIPQDNRELLSVNTLQNQFSENSRVLQANSNFDRINEEKQSDYSETSTVRKNKNKDQAMQNFTQNDNPKRFKNDKNQIASVSNLKPITNVSENQNPGKSNLNSRVSANIYSLNNSNNKIMQKGHMNTGFSSMRRSKMSKNANQFIDHGELGNIEAIIDQIDLFMQKSAPIIKASNGLSEQEQEKYITKGKKKTKLAGANKNQFRNQWKQSSNKINKLDQMLSGYRTTEDPFQKYKKQKQDKNKGLNFGGNNSFGYKPDYVQNQYQNEYLNQQNEFNEQLTAQGQDSVLTLIVLVRWQALPIFPVPYKDIMLKFPSYPQQQSYESLLKKVLQNKIKHFSVFYKHENTNQNIAGVGQNEQNQSLTLLSEQQYAMKWESMFTGGQILAEQEIQTLMEYDIQWYRTIVDFVYKGGLQEVLERQNGYDIFKYVKLVRQLSQDLTNSQNSTLIDQNRVQFIKSYIKNQQALVTKGKKLKYSILATKSSIMNHANTIKQQIGQTFIRTGGNILTLSILNTENQEKGQCEMTQNGDIIVKDKIAIRVKEFDQESAESQTTIGDANQNIKVTFQVIPIKQTGDLQIRIKKADTEQKTEQLKLKDEVQFGKIYAVYEKKP